jgi:hypothetical protein
MITVICCKEVSRLLNHGVKKVSPPGIEAGTSWPQLRSSVFSKPWNVSCR